MSVSNYNQTCIKRVSNYKYTRNAIVSHTGLIISHATRVTHATKKHAIFQFNDYCIHFNKIMPLIATSHCQATNWSRAYWPSSTLPSGPAVFCVNAGETSKQRLRESIFNRTEVITFNARCRAVRCECPAIRILMSAPQSEYSM